MLFVLIAFALPGVMPWAWLPEAPLFGIDQSVHEHDRITGPISGVWMLIFTLPVLLLTPDAPPTGWRFAAAAKAGIQDVLETVKQVRHYKNVAIYLLARMLYNDGMVGVLVFGGVYAAGNFDGTPYRCLFLDFAPA